MQNFFTVAGVAVALVALTSTADALAIRSAPALEPIVTDVASRVCVRDDRGWHNMRGERRVTCRPSRPSGLDWIWRAENGRTGWWHRKESRWHD